VAIRRPRRWFLVAVESSQLRVVVEELSSASVAAKSGLSGWCDGDGDGRVVWIWIWIWAGESTPVTGYDASARERGF